jgi:hypothetical protein
MLDGVWVASLSELAENEGLTRAGITQIMKLLRLAAEMQEFFPGLDDPKEIWKYSERKLRHGVLAVADNFFVDRIN